MIKAVSESSERARALSPALRNLLAHKFDARLAGSWAADEAHVPRTCNHWVHSLSDVDVLIDELPTVSGLETIACSVVSLARTYGVEISKVSVRSKGEIDSFWNPQELLDVPSPKRLGHFLTFWALIGALEATGGSAHAVGVRRSYILAKFFFKLCRNFLLIRVGRNFLSYRVLVEKILENLISHPAVLCAYAVKIGHRAVFTTADCELILSDATWEPLTVSLIDQVSCRLLSEIRSDMRGWYIADVPLRPDSYLAALKSLQPWPALLPAYEKALRDHECRKTG
jgi:hypothetical protein